MVVLAEGRVVRQGVVGEVLGELKGEGGGEGVEG